MPSVASEAHAALSSRSQVSHLRSNSKADNAPASSPFADMLDSATPPEAPSAPRHSQSDRAERPDRPDQPKPSNDRGSDSAPAKDSQAKDSRSKSDTDTKDVKDSGSSKDAAAASDSKEAKSDATTDKTAESTDKPTADADAAAALDALFLDAAPVQVTPQAVVAAVTQPAALAAAAAPSAEAADADVEADALAALQAATQAGAPKPSQQQQQQQNGIKVDAHAKPAAAPGALDPQAAVPQVDTGKDGQAQAKGEKTSGEFHRVAADLFAKAETGASAIQGTDVGTAKPGAEVAQNVNVLTPAAHTMNAAANATPAVTTPAQVQAQAAAVPLTGLAVEIATQSSAGKNHFEIRLDPPELGRINVHLDVDRDGNVSTKLVVDRADTLDLLKRDASSLERALQQAGLKTSDNAMEFSLRQHAFSQDDKGAQAGTGSGITLSDDDPAPLEALRQGYGRLLGLGGGLDIRV